MLHLSDKKSPRYIRMVPMIDKEGASYKLVTADGTSLGVAFDSGRGGWRFIGAGRLEPAPIHATNVEMLIRWMTNRTQMLIVVN